MEQLHTYLSTKPSNQTLYYPHKYIYLTTTDNYPHSYILPMTKVKAFLSKYASLLEDDTHSLHVNILLNGLTHHMLCIDVDYSKTSTMIEPTHHDHENLYKHVIEEIQNEMKGLHIDNKGVYDAYYMMRADSINYHLVFPNIYMNRVDYEYFIYRMKSKHSQIDTCINGWLLYNSSKRVNQSAYQVIGQLKHSRITLISDPELSILLRDAYKNKRNNYIYTHLFFPGEYKDSFKLCAFFNYPITISQRVSDINYLLSYTTLQMNTFYLTITKRSCLSNREEWPNDLYHWCKANQDQCQIRSSNNMINNFLRKFFPPITQFDEEEVSPEVEVNFDELEMNNRELFLLLDGMFSLNQFIMVINDYHCLYTFALSDIYARRKNSIYTFKSILYEMVYRFGHRFEIPSIYICKKHLQMLKRMVLKGETEKYYQYMGGCIIPTVPVKVSGKEVYLFNWEKRKWCLYNMNTFTNLFLNVLMDYLIDEVTNDDELKKVIRRSRAKFTDLSRLESILIYGFSGNYCFDRNPWLLGLEEPHVLDLKTCQCRLAIPEDLVTKHTYYGFIYQNAEFFDIFLNEESYLQAFENLKMHIGNNQPIETFQCKGIEAIDHLFRYLSLIFCDEFKEMLFFLEFLAQSLIGRNFRRWILFLLGNTSNSKTSITKLCMHALNMYCGILNAGNFYSSGKNTQGVESACPQLNSVLFDRIVIIEEVNPFIQMNGYMLNQLSGNNRLFTRDLYKSGSENDVHFNMIFTMNNYPMLTVTPALKERIQILKFNSSFLLECIDYNFQTRRFPQAPNLNVETYGEAFTSLLIHTLSRVNHQTKIQIPESVRENFRELDHW